eukprot:429463-Rhodomonas_salina.1
MKGSLDEHRSLGSNWNVWRVVALGRSVASHWMYFAVTAKYAERVKLVRKVRLVWLGPSTIGEEGGCRSVVEPLARAKDDLRGQVAHGVLELSVQTKRRLHQLEVNPAVGHVLDLVVEGNAAVLFASE